MSKNVRETPRAVITDNRFDDCELIIEDDTTIQQNIFIKCKIRVSAGSANK